MSASDVPQASLNLRVDILMISQVLLDDVTTGRREQTGPLDSLQFRGGQLQPHSGVLVVVSLETDGVMLRILDGHSAKGE